MPRNYRHVKEYENEILKLRGQGLTRQGFRTEETCHKIYGDLSPQRKVRNK